MHVVRIRCVFIYGFERTKFWWCYSNALSEAAFSLVSACVSTYVPFTQQFFHNLQIEFCAWFLVALFFARQTGY